MIIMVLGDEYNNSSSGRIIIYRVYIICILCVFVIDCRISVCPLYVNCILGIYECISGVRGVYIRCMFLYFIWIVYPKS